MKEGEFEFYEVQFLRSSGIWSGGYGIGFAYQNSGYDDKWKHVLRDYNTQRRISGHHGYSTLEIAMDAQKLAILHSSHDDWKWRIVKINVSKQTTPIATKLSTNDPVEQLEHRDKEMTEIARQMSMRGHEDEVR